MTTRLVVAGAGLIGRRHVEHIVADPAFELAAIVDPVAPEETHGAPHFATLDACEVEADGIVIATPTQSHLSTFREAAERGWHALIEKPLAETLDDAREIERIAHETGVKAMTGHHRRFHPKVAALKSILDAGDIGTPVLAQAMWAVKKPDDYFDVPWRAGRAGAPVQMNVSHEVDLLTYLLGPVENVTALGSAPVRQAGRTETGGAVLRFASGAIATIAFTDTAPTPWGFEHGTGENPNIALTGEDSLRIVGTAGAVSFPSLRVWTGARDWSEAPQMTAAPDPGAEPPLLLQLHHFARVIAGEEPPRNDAASGCETLRITLAIEDAALPPGCA